MGVRLLCVVRARKLPLRAGVSARDAETYEFPKQPGNIQSCKGVVAVV